MSSAILAGEYVTDTVALILYVEKRKLGTEAEKVFDAAENARVIVHIPAMVLAEILYLSERNRISTSLTDVFKLLTDFPSFRVFPLDSSVAEVAAEIVDIPELHDRLISAVARLLNASLITNDPKIMASAFVHTVW